MPPATSARGHAEIRSSPVYAGCMIKPLRKLDSAPAPAVSDRIRRDRRTDLPCGIFESRKILLPSEKSKRISSKGMLALLNFRNAHTGAPAKADPPGSRFFNRSIATCQDPKSKNRTSYASGPGFLPASFRGARSASPEPIPTGSRVRHTCGWHVVPQHPPGVMDSWLSPSGCPGMTTQKDRKVRSAASLPSRHRMTIETPGPPHPFGQAAPASAQALISSPNCF